MVGLLRRPTLRCIGRAGVRLGRLRRSVAVGRAGELMIRQAARLAVVGTQERWYRLVVETTGLMATCNLGQPFEFGRACEFCGAGATPVDPLYIDANRMGKKLLDSTAHDLRIVVRRELAEFLEQEKLTGFMSGPVAHKTETRARPDERFVWLEPTFEWPPLSPDSILAREDQCPSCGRSGHFDSPSPATSLCYRSVPVNATDFGATFEYFGRWRARGKAGPNVGGGRLTLVSGRFKDALRSMKVRHVSFESIALS